MHQEATTHEGGAAGLPAFAVMSAQGLDERERGMRGEGLDDASDLDIDGLRAQRPPRVVTPAVERVLAWHRQHSM